MGEKHPRRDATLQEIQTLRHVVDTLPAAVWIALLAGSSERFTYYAVTTPWQNYVQNDASSSTTAVPGLLGLGQATATNISNAFNFFAYLSPVPFGILADTWLGHYNTLVLSISLNLCGCLALFITSLPQVTQDQAVQIAGLALAMVLLGLGTGGARASVLPFIGDQYTVTKPQVIVTKNGEKVIADRALTMEYIYNVYYWFVNIASLSMIPSTYLEKDFGFWAAYLLAFCAFGIVMPLLLCWQKTFGNVLPRAGRVILLSMRERFHLSAAEPEYQAEKHGRSTVVDWDAAFVSEIRRGLNACKIMFCFIPFFLAMTNLTNNLVSQAGQMQLSGGLPNDMFQALNPIACVLLGPVVQKLLYPFLRRHPRVPSDPVSRMAWSFLIAGVSMACCAAVQKVIYVSPPCYASPLACPAAAVGGERQGGGARPNEASVWLQTPIYFVLALAEIIGLATLSDYSYEHAPPGMRGAVQSIRWVSAALGSALGMALSPLAKDPDVLWLYVGLAGLMVVAAVSFWWIFRGQGDEGRGQIVAGDEEVEMVVMVGMKEVGNKEMGNERTRGSRAE